tara:strand:- start:109 stop:288 length:180 start_codon:yes stop_codon:yes gene_type:complete
VDKLASEFTEIIWTDQIRSCTDMEELKALSESLVKMHFASKRMIGRLLLEGLPTISDQE